jgi:hypothetical protein
VEKKRHVRLAMHQGSLSNREGGQGVTGADKSMKNPHGGEQMEKEWLGGTEEDTRPDLAHRRGGWCGVEADR